jgi:hypothetical protein
MDLLAWFIVVVFYLSCVVPLVGDALVGRITTYTEAITIGVAFHAALIGFGLVLFSVLWAWLRLTA